MRKSSRWMAVLAMLVLFAAACGQGDDGSAGDGETGADAAEEGSEVVSADESESASEEPTEDESASEAPSEDPSDEPSEDESSSEDTADGAAFDAEGCLGSVAVMAPITGDAASIGEEQRNWAQLSLDQFNEANGSEFELLEADTQLDPAQASTVVQQLVSDDSVIGIAGPAGSQEVEAIGPVLAQADLAMVSMSATRTDLTAGDYPTFFRVIPTDAQQGPTDATYMLEELGATSVVIVDDQTSYSTGLADEVQRVLEEGGATVQRESVTETQTDFSALVSTVPDDAQVVFAPTQIAANTQLFGQQLQEQGKTAVLFGADGSFSPDFNLAGAYVSAFAPDITGLEGSAEVVEAYTAEYGEEFGTFGPPTYVAVQTILEAAARACAGGEVDRAGVLEELPNTDIAESILGIPITFDDAGDVEGGEFFIFQVAEGGEFELVQ